MVRQFTDLAKTGMASVQQKLREGFIRAEPDRLYTTTEDFRRADSDYNIKRIVVIGGSGVGKSTLLNIVGGRRLVISDDGVVWKNKQGDEITEDQLIFYATDDCPGKGVTEKAALAHLNWMGDSERRFIAVDTVGVADPELHDISDARAQEKAEERACDLHDKLTNLGHIDALLVLHGDAISGKCNNGVMEVLQMLDSKFPTSDFWNNVIVAFTKCNACDKTWRLKTKRIGQNTEEIIRQMFPRSQGVQVPIIHLGGLTEDDADVEDGGFEKLWDFIKSRNRLDTSNLLPFDDSFRKYKKAIDERNKAEALAKANRIYGRVVSMLVLALLFLVARAWFVPEILMWFTLNSEWMGLTATLWDEILFFVACVYYIGPQDVWNSLQLFYEYWLQAHVEVHIEPLLARVFGNERKMHED